VEGALRALHDAALGRDDKISYLVSSLSTPLFYHFCSPSLPLHILLSCPLGSCSITHHLSLLPLPAGCAGRGTLRGPGRQDISGEEVPSVPDPTRPLVRASCTCQSLSLSSLLQHSKFKRQNFLQRELSSSLITACVIFLTCPVTVPHFHPIDSSSFSLHDS
jgi:hypothetical protein